jgi:hypothetical protein
VFCCVSGAGRQASLVGFWVSTNGKDGTLGVHVDWRGASAPPYVLRLRLMRLSTASCGTASSTAALLATSVHSRSCTEQDCRNLKPDTAQQGHSQLRLQPGSRGAELVGD